MKKTIYNFERVEKKYLLNQIQYYELIKKILPYIEKDTYSDYSICNIYFDTDAFDLIRESIEKPPFKEKMRVRSYGIPLKKDIVFLELKKKYNHTVFKRRISCSLSDAENFWKLGVPIAGNTQIFNELEYFMMLYQPQPKLFLAYDRIAYRAKNNYDIRITFDTNLRYRTENLDLSIGDEGEPYFEEPIYLMEIKVPCALPIWLVKILSQEHIYPTSFSKYGSIYTKKLAKTIGGLAHV